MEISGGAGESEEWGHLVEMQSEWRRHHKPDNETPGSVAVDVLLGSSGDLFVFFCGMCAFRNGVGFTVQARARTVLSDDSETDRLFEGMSGHRDQADRLLLGFEFADGRSCSNLRGQHGCAPNRQDRPLLSTGGGGGSGGSAEFEYFLSPLPPPGDLRIVCAWPEHGIAETVTVLSTDDILQTALRPRGLDDTWRRQRRSVR